MCRVDCSSIRFSVHLCISRMNGDISTKLVTINDPQVEMKPMTLRRSLVQRSRSQMTLVTLGRSLIQR